MRFWWASRGMEAAGTSQGPGYYQCLGKRLACSERPSGIGQSRNAGQGGRHSPGDEIIACLLRERGLLDAK